MVFGWLVGGLFALVALAIGCISFPLAIDRKVASWQVLVTSVRSVLLNPVLALACGAMVGLGLILPMLGHANANWHLCRELIG